MPSAPMSAIVSTSGYVSGSHMIICGFFSMPGHDRHGRELGRVLDRLVGVDVAEQDVVVGVELRRHGLEADGRPAGADLDVDAGVDAADGDERAARRRTRVLVDLVVVADHLVDPAVLGLGVPVGLDDDGLRAVGRPGRRRPAAPSRRTSCRCPRSSRCRSLGAAGGGRLVPGAGRRGRRPRRPGGRRGAGVVVVVVAAAGGERRARRRPAGPATSRCRRLCMCLSLGVRVTLGCVRCGGRLRSTSRSCGWTRASAR